MAVDLQNQSGRGSARAGDEASPGASFAPVGAAQDPSRPLSQLAERLGALEQSLTVVASEIGVAGMPRFRHVDAESIYAEAERRGRQAIEQAQHSLLERIDRTGKATVASAAGLARDIAVLGRRIDEALAGLAAVRQPIEALQHHAEQQGALSASMAALEQRLARIESERPSPSDMSEAQFQPLQDRLDRLDAHLHTLTRRDAAPIDDELRRRLEALEQRSRIAGENADAEWPLDGGAQSRAAQAAPTVEPLVLQRELDPIVEQRLSRLAAELEARLQARLDAQTTPPVAPPAGDPFAPMALPAGDIPGLREAIVEQLVTLLDRRNEAGEAVPLLVEQRGIEASPLVMNAAERAIVRLTRRIEKLENRAGEAPAPRPASPRLGSRTGRSLMGRLFES